MRTQELSISERLARIKARLEKEKSLPELPEIGPFEAPRKATKLAADALDPGLLGPEPDALPLPQDPRAGWHLTTINVHDAWADYSGRGVTVSVIDNGFSYRHPDLVANYNQAIDWDFRDNDADPISSASGDGHGTRVAGVIAAASNDIGGVGVAHGAELTGFRIGFGTAGSIAKTAAALDAAWRVSDVVNSSWSYTTAFQDNFARFGYAAAGDAMKAGVTQGRDGLGSIFVFSAGNSRAAGDNVNYHNFQNSPYAIAVAGTTSSDVYGSWSNPGAALLISAPGSNIVTTADGNGYATVSGTSFAAPVVSGVVALMLEANDALGYRDVQEILAYSAAWNHKTHADWQDNGAANWNGGGLHFNHNYGFGLVDATAAVRLAETWTIQRTAHNALLEEWTATPRLAIPDGQAAGVTSSIRIDKAMELDSVQVHLAIDHARLADLTIILESPSGTRAVLADRPNATDNLDFTFTAKTFWGEDPTGEWKLTVIDKVSGNTGTLKSWKLSLHGDAASKDDTYFFSDDYGALTDPARQVLEDKDGGVNSINAAMVTGDVVLDLTAGMTGTIAGKPLVIAAGTVIQNAWLGDGDDRVTGNDADNIILGGRGDDILDGGGGIDTAKYFGQLDQFDVLIVDARTVRVTFTADLGIDEGSDLLTNFEFFDFGGTVYSFEYLVEKFGAPPPPPVNEAPVLAEPIADQAVDEKTPFEFVIPAAAFADPDGDALTYKVTLASGGDLPPWLSFDAATRTLSGTPGEQDDGVLDIRVTATDPDGLSVSDQFRLTVRDVNEVPVLTTPIADQSVDEKTPFAFVIPAAAFTDPDGDALTYKVTLANGGDLPSWLSFDAATRTLTGTPGEQDDGVLDIRVTATDPDGLSVSDQFRLTVHDVNEAPVLAAPIADQSVDEKTPFAFVIPAAAFADPDGDTLTYKVTLANGGDLPSWLSFDAATRTLTGTPGEQDDGVLDIRITATDPKGLSVSDQFRLTVRDVNEAPVLAAPIADQSVDEKTPFEFVIPAAAFADPDGDALTYKVTLADGGDLPSWLSFDAATRTLSGTPGEQDGGVLDIHITATDPDGLSASSQFRLTVHDVNEAPVLVAPIADQSVDEKTPFAFVIPAAAFADPDGDALTYKVTLADGGDLPSWLSFDAATHTLSGTPGEQDDGVLDIRVTATDPKGLSVSDQFRLTVRDINEAPVLVAPIADQSVDEKTPFEFVIPAAAFADPDGDALTYKVALADGGDLPSWLSFDAATHTLSGTPGEQDDGVLDIRVTATDPKGLSVSDQFRLTVRDVNEAPVLVASIADQAVDEKTPFEFVIPAAAFADPDGDALTYKVTLADGGDLPSWLSFDATTRTLSGTPGEQDDGVFDIRVMATDSDGLSVSDQFRLTVRDVNEAPVLATPIADQSVDEKTPFTFVIPAAAFVDPDGGALTYNVILADGGDLPSWLSFDAVTRTLSGTPGEQDDGVLDIRVTATDPKGLSVSDQFRLTVRDVNEAPVLVASIADQAVDEKTPFEFVIPAAAFADPDGDALTYKVTLADGGDLPSWLSFDGTTRTLSGTPGEQDDGVLDIRVTAIDPDGLSASSQFRLTVRDVNEAPVLAAVIADQETDAGEDFTFALPGDLFRDPDGDSLVFSAHLADGGALPEWLSFDAERGIFTGIPDGTDAGALEIRVTAADPGGATATANFTLRVAELPPVPEPEPEPEPEPLPPLEISAAPGDAIAAADLFGVQPEAGRVNLWAGFDATGHWQVNGVAMDRDIVIDAADFGAAYWIVGSGGTTEDLWFRTGSNDGGWSDWASSSVSATAFENLAPVAIGTSTVIDVSETVLATSLFAVSDPNDDAILQYQLWGGVRGTGHWNMAGELNNTFLTLTPEQFADLAWTGEEAGRTEKIWLRAFDGEAWGDWYYADVTVAPTAFDDIHDPYLL